MRDGDDWRVGQDLELFWQHYPIHYRKNALATLEQYCIGQLSDVDQAALRQPACTTDGKSRTASRRWWDTVPTIVEATHCLSPTPSSSLSLLTDGNCVSVVARCA